MKFSFKALRNRWTGKPQQGHPTRQMAIAARKAGDTARDAGDWASAIDHYAHSLRLDGTNWGVSIQYGHVLKEAGQLDAAVGAYRQAIALNATDADAHLQLGHALKLTGRTAEAIEAYAQAVCLDPACAGARDELVALGARDRLPSSVTGRTAATQNLARLHHLLEQGLEAARTLNTLSTYPIESYDLFRRHYPVHPPPPQAGSPTEVVVLIEAAQAPAHALRATLRSLQDQRHRAWRAMVCGSRELLAHPVASMAFEDSRIRLSSGNQDCLDDLDQTNQPVVLLDAGTVLDPEALGWLCYAGSRTGADMVYADHDSYEPHWRYGDTRRDPVLFASFDPDDLKTSPWVPATLFLQPQMVPELRNAASRSSSDELRQALLLSPGAGVRRAHLPRLLSSQPHDSSLPSTTSAAGQASGQQTAADRILVIVPTRDEPEMLRTCIASLKACANHPERVDVLIVDNQSSAKSKAQFTELQDGGQARVLDFDEPFNWARINNRAVDSIRCEPETHDIIVFSNNDIEALSLGWDDQVAAAFADPSIGVVGARLLYPDGRVQHAGILLGGHESRPVHDGLHDPASAPGPLGRLHRQRGVAAVTGAFMAVRASLFDAIGGFDPSLAVAYNDVDFCLKARAAGARVVYAPAIELIHHESVSRGTNFTPDKIAWDDSELATLYARWGEWMFRDHTRNPHWTSSHLKPFDGFREPSLTQVLDWLDLSARSKPWSIDHQVSPDSLNS